MNGIFEIKAAGEDELNLIRHLANEIWPKVYQQLLTKEQSAYMMKMMYAPDVMLAELSSGISFYLAWENGAPVGFSSWGAYEDDEAKLHKLYLHENMRGKGYGRRMLAFIAGEAKNAGFKTLRLNVNRSNKNSVAAYLACGFKKIEEVDVSIGNNFFMNDFVMQKIL